jgi:chorismate lyase
VWARRWATSRGSLTKRLIGLGQGFDVQLVALGTAYVSHGPVQPPSCSTVGTMKQRLVRLKVGGQTVVLAQTLMSMNGVATDWPFWKGLGRRSLGSRLFTDPLVHRGDLFFARLPAKHPWVMRLFEGQPAQVGLDLSSVRVWYARCARFDRKPGRTPLWVMEVFLPSLKHFV